MIIHSIISEQDIFYMPGNYTQNNYGTAEIPPYSQNNQKNNPANIVPCITDPAMYLKGKPKISLP